MLAGELHSVTIQESLGSMHPPLRSFVEWPEEEEERKLPITLEALGLFELPPRPKVRSLHPRRKKLQVAKPQHIESRPMHTGGFKRRKSVFVSKHLSPPDSQPVSVEIAAPTNSSV